MENFTKYDLDFVGFCSWDQLRTLEVDWMCAHRYSRRLEDFRAAKFAKSLAYLG